MTDAEMRRSWSTAGHGFLGRSFIQCISQANVFSITHCRMLEIGFRTGSADSVMAEIARRAKKTFQNDIEGLVAAWSPPW